MRPIYKSMIMTFIVSLPAFLFMSFDLYSYYCQPLKKLENVPAELAVIKNSRGVRYELGMIVYINEKKHPTGFIVDRANSMEVLKSTVYGNYMDKKFLVDLGYKEGVFKSFPFASKIIPISVRNKEIIFIGNKESRKLFFYRFYNILWFFSSFVFAFILAIFLKFLSDKQTNLLAK